jgi:biopolymer transport protein ExbB
MFAKIRLFIMLAALGGLFAPALIQPAGAQEVAEGIEVAEGAEAETTSSGFGQVLKSGGPVGALLWIALFGASIAGLSFAVDSAIQVREKKLIPPGLVEQVQAAMEQGDILKAQQVCQEAPSAMANILNAAFTNVEDGFDAVQDAVTVTGDLESEKVMQRVNYLNVVGNIAPMLGLLGTVVGMIFAFETLAQAGAGAAALLAQNISMALWTTAAGLVVAVPSMASFYFFKNKATKIILTMEQISMNEINILRHVEVE